MTATNKLDYMSYLQVDKITSAQRLMSEEAGEPCHVEMLYIIVHQVYELWFKQILHELQSVIQLFNEQTVDERNIGVAVSRLSRISNIQSLLIDQIDVLETMTPLEFLDFRALLGTASGFQSFQFRLLENRFGLRRSDRIMYGNKEYFEEFSGEKRETLLASESEPNLFSVVNEWLQRTPFLRLQEYDFISQYQASLQQIFDTERKEIGNIQNEALRSERAEALLATEKTFASYLNAESHNKKIANGYRRLSYEATVAALFISLYRTEPILQEPFNLLSLLIEIDENFTLWRSRHAMMVHRMLGKKTGTGQSSGYDYLRRSIEKYRVFTDLFDLSTLLIPQRQIPTLEPEMLDFLRFHFTVSKRQNS